MAQWTCAQIAATTVRLNFKQSVGRNHWPSCWHGSYGIIYNPLQSPQSYVGYITLSNQWYIPSAMVKYEESQDNSLSHLKTRGLRWHDSANLASFSKFKNPRTMEGKIARSRRLLLFEGRQKISGLKSIWQLQNPGSMKMFQFKTRFKRHLSPIKRWSSQSPV